MSKVRLIDLSKIQVAEGEVKLYPEEGEPIHIWAVGDCPFTVYACAEETMYPLFTNTQLDETINFAQGITELRIVSVKKTGRFSFRVQQKNKRMRDVVSSVPTHAIVPLDENSFQNRVRQAVEMALSQHGINTDRGSGVDYEYYDDDEFGPGFMYDPETEQEAIESAVSTVKQRFLDKLRPSEHGPSDDGRSLDTDDQKTTKKSSGKRAPGSKLSTTNSDQSERERSDA